RALQPPVTVESRVVPGHEFLFALQLSDDFQFDAMLSDLASSVLRHAGYAASVIAQLGDALRAGVANGRTEGTCEVQFRAHAGEFEIVVSQAGREIFRTSRRLPG